MNKLPKNNFVYNNMIKKQLIIQNKNHQLLVKANNIKKELLIQNKNYQLLLQENNIRLRKLETNDIIIQHNFYNTIDKKLFDINKSLIDINNIQLKKEINDIKNKSEKISNRVGTIEGTLIISSSLVITFSSLFSYLIN
jgi:hypothetical protein